jgi:NAD(P)-dependent dehydrogenase (short-subunit alcohol dehydrogenase family)
MTNSVAIVTGASQGIGRSTAVRLARDFGSIVLVARNRAKLEETAAEVAAVSATPPVIDLDLSERSSAKVVVEPRHPMQRSARSTPRLSLLQRHSRIAGIARYGEPEEIAELMAFLLSPGARWMTGSTLRMDGGEVKSI